MSTYIRIAMTLALGVCLWRTTVAQADAPAYLPIQGYIANASGVALDETVSIRFRLYDKAADGAVLFEESNPMVKVEKGYFTVYLGEEKALPLTLFRDHPSVFVGVYVSGDTTELAPRLQLATAPYAAFAQVCGDASTVGGKPASAFRPSTYVPAWSEVTGKPTTFSVNTADALAPLVKVLGSRDDLGFNVASQTFVQAGTIVAITDASSGYAVVGFNAPFPNGVLAVIPVNGDANSGDFVPQIVSTSLSQVTVTTNVLGGAVRINYIAIGW